MSVQQPIPKSPRVIESLIDPRIDILAESVLVRPRKELGHNVPEKKSNLAVVKERIVMKNVFQ